MTRLFSLSSWSPRILWCTGLEAILEFAWNTLHVAHATGTGGLSSLSLLAPVVLPNFGCWVSAGRACVLLNVERSATAASAQSVRLVVALSETGCTFRHFDSGTIRLSVSIICQINELSWT